MSRRPQKIDVKIGTPEEAMWTNVRDRIKASISGMEKQIMVDKKFLEVAESELEKEKQKS